MTVSVCEETQEETQAEIPGQAGDAIKSMQGKPTGEAGFHDDYAQSLHEEIQKKINKPDGVGHAHDLSDVLGHGAIGYESPQGAIAVQPPKFQGDSWTSHFINPEDTAEDLEEPEAPEPEPEPEPEPDPKPKLAEMPQIEDEGFDDIEEGIGHEIEDYEYENWGLPKQKHQELYQWPKSHQKDLENHLKNDIGIEDPETINGILSDWHQQWQAGTEGEREYNRAFKNVMERLVPESMQSANVTVRKAGDKFGQAQRNLSSSHIAKLRDDLRDNKVDEFQEIPGWEQAVSEALEPDNAAALGMPAKSDDESWDNFDTQKIADQLGEMLVAGRKHVDSPNDEKYHRWFWETYGPAVERFKNREPSRKVKEPDIDAEVLDDEGNPIPFSKPKESIRYRKIDKMYGERINDAIDGLIGAQVDHDTLRATHYRKQADRIFERIAKRFSAYESDEYRNEVLRDFGLSNHQYQTIVTDAE